MSSNVEPEELAAIRDVVERIGAQTLPRQLEKRNFDEPRRLSAEELRRLGRGIAETLPAAAQSLAATLRRNYKLTLADAAEVNASRLFSRIESPFLVWCFEFAGQPGWLVWDPAAAARLLATILCGSAPEDDAARHFSASERRVLAHFLTEMVAAITRPFPRPVTSICVAQDDEELDPHRELPGDSDKQRLLVHLAWDGPGGPSDLRFYLPGIITQRSQAAEQPRAPLAMPQHVGGIPLDVVAYLGSIDVPLADLLGIEIGDVVPIDLDAGSPLEMYVEDRRYATAAWGRHQGRLALKLIEIDSHAGSIDQPDS